MWLVCNIWLYITQEYGMQLVGLFRIISRTSMESDCRRALCRDQAESGQEGEQLSCTSSPAAGPAGPHLAVLTWWVYTESPHPES
jgi:hypothetical protein